MKYQKPILMSIFLAYTASWSYITVMKFFAMNTNVFDLGLFMEYGWIVLHQVHTVSSFFYWFSYNGIIYVVSPITQLDSYPAVLVFQSAFIGFAVFPLFGVARHYLHDDVSALLISASYLVYFPLVGVNWFDAHYQALFPTLFLLGYYFYTKERLAPSAVFFILSSMVRYPYFIFAFLFALIVLGGQLLKRRNMDARKVWFSLIIIAFGLFITALFYLFYSHGAFATNALGTVRLSSAGTNISEAKFETLVLFFLPLLFLPLLSRKWVIFYVPFFYLVFATNFWGYLYPNVFALQYPAGIVPFLFLGTIDGVVLIGRSRKRAVSAMVLIAVVAFALAYEPYGPLNGSSGIDYNFKQQISANMGLYNEMNRVISLINKTDPYVLFQSNIPQVLPRPLQYVRTPLITNLQEVTYNFMHIYPNGTSVPVRVDYVLSDPYSGWYYFNQAPPYNASMYDFVRELYNSTDYGLLAEASGIMLLERNYTGSVKYFAPLDNSFSTSQMLSAGLQKGDLFNYTNLDNKNFKIEWYGPYATLYPGTYTATYWLYTTSNSSPILLQVTAEGGTVTLVSKMLEPGTLKQGEWNRVNLTFYSDGILTGAEFRGLIAGYSGTLLFGGVNLTQVGPGLPNSHDYYVFPDQLSTRGALR
ncbi:MAG: DUF2079 domain-containing protein, partial [Nitrososphaerota archaeon]|nr:DUF2079 domain-containing protein [Nitrososphaerota archaeon]